MEIYIKPPTKFILSNWQQLLPQWTTIPQTVILILLPAKYCLDDSTILIESEKNRLLTEFFNLARSIQDLCNQQQILSEIISPKDGFPFNSTKGNFTFDLVAIIHESLGFKFQKTSHGCKIVHHPNWGQAMYPGMMVSLGSRETISQILANFSGQLIV